MRRLHLILTSVVLLSIFLGSILTSCNPDKPITNVNYCAKECTIFTIAQGGKTFFAGNLDYRKDNPLIIGISPPTDSEYGSVRLGFLVDGDTNYEMAMNDQGVAWDINSIPDTPLNQHPERTYAGWGAFLTTVTNKASSVDDAIKILGMFDTGDALEHCQLHISDASGNAVVIGPGPYREIVITMKQPEDIYLISTNYNRAIPLSANHPETYLRYDNTVNMLEEVNEGTDFTVEYLASILNVNHFESMITYTLYSYIFDSADKTVHIYYLSNFNEDIEINFMDEFARGQRWYYLEDLLPEKEQDIALSKYNGVVTRDVFILIILALSAIVSIFFLVTMIVKLIKRFVFKNWTKQPSFLTYALFGLAISCLCLSLVLFNSHIYPPEIISTLQPTSLLIFTLVLSIMGLIFVVAAIIIIALYMKNNSKTGLFSSGWRGWLYISSGVLGLVAVAYMSSGIFTLLRQF